MFGNGFNSFGYINQAYAAPGMQNRLNAMQQQPIQPPQQPMQVMQGLKGRIVSSVDEVKAALIDLDGSNTFFPCPAENCIYVKSIDLNGSPVVQKFSLERPQQRSQYLELDIIQQLVQRVTRLETIVNPHLAKGGIANVQSNANDANDGTVTEQQQSNASNAINVG